MTGDSICDIRHAEGLAPSSQQLGFKLSDLLFQMGNSTSRPVDALNGIEIQASSLGGGTSSTRRLLKVTLVLVQ